MIVEPGKWYNTKRNYLCRIDSISQDGTAWVTSHYTGNKMKVPEKQVKFFMIAEEPDTLPGTAVMEAVNTESAQNEYNTLYTKYPNIVQGSIYRVQANVKTKEEIEEFEVDGKKRHKFKKKIAKGSTRCLVICQMEGCFNTRDIKIQDAFQVKQCIDCKKKKKKLELTSFLTKKKTSTTNKKKKKK
ncbi:hypothetical protein LCGC14_1328910 [marine sediment metagenome]|uniref:Uncharacterized protein n=1 Tax=marine sediment metagenome TaxID=412755 RepID=A0A0F9MY05_9ZZZZ